MGGKKEYVAFETYSDHTSTKMWADAIAPEKHALYLARARLSVLTGAIDTFLTAGAPEDVMVAHNEMSLSAMCGEVVKLMYELAPTLERIEGELPQYMRSRRLESGEFEAVFGGPADADRVMTSEVDRNRIRCRERRERIRRMRDEL